MEPLIRRPLLIKIQEKQLEKNAIKEETKGIKSEREKEDKVIFDLKTLEDYANDDEKDDQLFELEELEKVLEYIFKKSSREIDTFLNEMKRKSCFKSQSAISLRVIKDEIYKSRADDGRLFIFSGRDNNCKLNLTPVQDQKNNMALLYVPRSIKTGSEPIAEVSCGAFHIMLLSITGELYTCGDASQGALGIGPSKESVTVPTRVVIKKFKGERKVIMIAAGREHSMCITKQKELFTWGNGLNGRLGHGDEKSLNIPKEVLFLKENTPVLIAAGDSHSAMVSSKCKLLTWGGRL